MSHFKVWTKCQNGLDSLLLKELYHLKCKSPQKLKGLNGVSFTAMSQEELWRIMSTSRLISSLSVSIGSQRIIKGTRDFRQSLGNFGFHPYLPIEKAASMRPPTVVVKSFHSKLPHTGLLKKEILQYLGELPALREWKKSGKEKNGVKFKEFLKTYGVSLEKEKSKNVPPLKELSAVKSWAQEILSTKANSIYIVYYCI